MLKKILSLVVVLAMCLTLGTVMPLVDAADDTENGKEFGFDVEIVVEDTEEIHYLLIQNADDLLRLANMVNNDKNNCSGLYFKMTQDIDLSGVCGENVEGKGEVSWTPIGSSNRYFSGTFDGNEKEISGLYINAPTDSYLGSYQGLFGSISSATVKNLGVNGYISGNGYIGGVVGYISANTTIENCHNAGMVSGSGNYVGGSFGSYVGGIVGYISSTSTIENCCNIGTVNGYQYVGGVAGRSGYGTIENCYNTGKVSGNHIVGGVAGHIYNATMRNCFNTGYVECTKPSQSNSRVEIGGISGCLNNATMENCFNLGDVFSAGSYVGGVAGHIFTTSTVQNCYNTGNVSGIAYVGGVIGSVGDIGYPTSSNSNVLNCYNIGDVSADSGSDVGSIAGCIDYTSTSKNCYYLENEKIGGIGEDEGSENTANVHSITAEEFKIEDTFKDWTFPDPWIMSDTLGRPIFFYFPETDIPEPEEPEPDPPAITPPEPIENLVYACGEQELITPGSAETGTMVYGLSKEGVYSTNIPVGINAGIYEVWYKVIDEYGNNITEPEPLYIEIDKAIPKPGIPERTALFGQTLADVEPLPEGFTWNDDGTTSVGEVGTNYFSATFTPRDINNFYILEDVPIPVTVVSIIPPQVIEGLVYNRTAQELVVPGKTVMGTMVYMVEKVAAEEEENDGEEDDEKDKDEEEKDEDEDEGSEGDGEEEEGNEDEDNEEDGEEQIETQLLIMDDSEDWQIDLFDLLSDDDDYHVDTPTGENAGEYRVWYKVLNYNGNNNDTDPSPLIAAIAKANPVPPETDLNATVGQTLKDVKLPDGYTWVDSTQSVGKVGTNSFAATFTPKDTENFNTLSLMLNVKVTNPERPSQATTAVWPFAPEATTTTTTTTTTAATTPEETTVPTETTTTTTAPEVTTEPPSTTSPPPAVKEPEDEDRIPNTGIVLVVAPFVAATITVVVSRKRK